MPCDPWYTTLAASPTHVISGISGHFRESKVFGSQEDFDVL